MSAAASVFALSDRLAAKASPELIAADEQHFAAIGASLRRSIATAQERLDRLLKSPGGWGQHALERDLEVHRLSARVRALHRFGLDVCLGRIVAEDGAVTYIGRLGLVDDDGEPLLIDWRSPAAEPFFGATHAHPDGLTSRRRYRWTLGRISDYWDEVFTGDASAQAALDDQSAFIASLGGSRSARMRDVLGTIQADQDAIIRAGSHGALVVDGGPGTGKTVVALHRTAYLLYSDERLARGGVLFVGPNPGYVAYVSDVLPNLGEEGVQTCTLRDLVAEGVEAVGEADSAVAADKASGRLLDAIEAAVRGKEQPPAVDSVVETDWVEIVVTADDWADAFDSAERGAPHNEAREEVWDALLEILAEKYGIPSTELAEALADDDDLRRTFERAWPLLDPVALVATLVGLRDAWTTADLPLLDAARHRIGDPGARELQGRRAAAEAFERERMDQVIDNLLEADDGEGLVTMFRAGDLQDVLVDENALPVADVDALAGPFAHVVVDEAQELTDAEWAMLVRRCPSRSFTIVGDRAQARAGFPESWEERLARVGITHVDHRVLTINYRTPAEVMEAAEPVIRAELVDANVPTSVRRSGLPVIRGAAAELESVVDGWLAAHDDGLACVIGAPAYPGSARVRSLTPELAKGLEFDFVVLVDPDDWSAVDRYVAMTRATQQLVVLTSG